MAKTHEQIAAEFLAAISTGGPSTTAGKRTTLRAGEIATVREAVAGALPPGP